MPPQGQRKAAFRENKISVSSSNGPHYEGEKNDSGTPHGLGREISEDNKIIYVGSFKEGTRNGIGIFYGHDGIIYRVQYNEGQQIGLGTITYPDGGVYSGEIKDYKPNGFGVYRKTQGEIECAGFFEKDVEGLGKYTSKKIHEYHGELYNFTPEGLGCNNVHSVNLYCGKFTNHGYKIIGKKYDKTSKLIKYGNFTLQPNNIFYDMNGNGVTSYIPPTSLITGKRYLLKGNHKNDMYDGKGVERYEYTEKYYKFKGSENKTYVNSQDAKDFEKQVDDAVKDAITYAEDAETKVKDAETKVKDANTAEKDAEKVAKEADLQATKFEKENKTKAAYEAAKAAATPKEVDFKNVGFYEFPTGKMYKKMYEGTLGNDGKPYGYGTIKYIPSVNNGAIIFQGSFVNGGKNLLGKGSQNGFYEFDGDNVNRQNINIIENDNADIQTNFINKAIEATDNAIGAEKQKKQTEAEAAYTRLVEAEIPKHTQLVYGHITSNGIYDGGVNKTGEPHGLGKMVSVNNQNIYEGTFKDGTEYGLGMQNYHIGRRKYPLSKAKPSNYIYFNSFGFSNDIYARTGKDTNTFGDKNIENNTSNKTPEFIEVFKKNINNDIKNRLEKVNVIVKEAQTEAKKEANKLYDTAMKQVQDIIDERKGSVRIITFNDKTVYKGDIENGKPHGYGQITLKSNSVFQGVFDDGKCKFGKIVFRNITSVGFFDQNYNLNGYGKYNNQYSDTFKDDKCNGTRFADDMCGQNKALIEVIKERLDEDVKNIVNFAENAAIAAQNKVDAEEREIEFNKKTEAENAFNKNVSKLKNKFQDAFTDLETSFTTYIKNSHFKAADGNIKNANAERYTGQKNEKNLPHGLGEMILKDDLGTYTGEFQDGIANGLGKWISSTGNVYTGEFKNGAPNGSVIWKNQKNEYEYKGDVLSDNNIILKFGFGTKKIYKDEYIGEFKIRSTGFAEVNFANNDKFEGWLDVQGSNPQGFGKYTYNNGNIFIGFVFGENPYGMGILTQKSGKKLWSENFGKKNAIIPEDASDPLGVAMEQIVNDALQKVMDGKTDVLNRVKQSTSKAETASGNAEKKIKELPIKVAQDEYDTALDRAKIENVPTEVGVIGNYKGNVKDGKPHGYGVMTDSRSEYIGSFVDGKKSGLGKETFTSSAVDWNEYIGFFNNNSYSGWGKVTYDNKPVKYGEWHGHEERGIGYTSMTTETYYKVSPELNKIIEKNIENDVQAVVDKATAAAAKAGDDNILNLQTKLENTFIQIKQSYSEFQKIKSQSGNGPIRMQDTNTYIGDKNENGLPHGHGNMVLEDGTSYLGQFKDGVAEGYGEYGVPGQLTKKPILWGLLLSVYKTYDMTVTGQFKGGGPSGSVVIQRGPYTYKGDILTTNNKEIIQFGFGQLSNNSETHIGELKNDLSGFKEIEFKEDGKFEGWYNLNKESPQGFGKLTYKNGDTYEGFIMNGKPHGMGILTQKGTAKFSENFDSSKTENPKDLNTTLATSLKPSFDSILKQIEATRQAVLNNGNTAVENAEAAAKLAEAAAKLADTRVETAARIVHNKASKEKEALASPKKSAEDQYNQAIADATPKADDKITVGEIIKSDGKIKYFGQVKGDPKTWYGYGKIIYSEHSTFTGSFVTDEPKGFGKLEFAEKSGSPLKEYYGFVNGNEPQGIGIGVFRNDNKEEFHMMWNGNKFEKSDQDTAADSLVTQIKKDAENFVKRATDLSIEKSGWGLKEYGLASAAAGVAAAGLYYAYKKYNQPAKQKQSSKKRIKKGSDQKRSKKRSDQKRSSKKRSKKPSDQKGSDQKRSDQKRSDQKRSDQKRSSKKRSKKRSDQKLSDQKLSDKSSQKPSERRSERVSAKLRSAPRSNRRSRRRSSI